MTARILPSRLANSALFAFHCLVSSSVRIAYMLLFLYQENNFWKFHVWDILVLREIPDGEGDCQIDSRPLRSARAVPHAILNPLTSGKFHSSSSDLLDMATMTSRLLLECHWHGSIRVPSLKSRLVPTVAYKPNLSQLRGY